jgi:hypothetical protein
MLIDAHDVHNAREIVGPSTCNAISAATGAAFSSGGSELRPSEPFDRLAPLAHFPRCSSSRRCTASRANRDQDAHSARYRHLISGGL